MLLQVAVPAPPSIRMLPHGMRAMAAVTSGSFAGPRLRGRVVGGNEWTILRSNGVFELDLQIRLEADDGALVDASIFAMRHGSPDVGAAIAGGCYFPATARFQTASPRYSFLNKLLARV